MAAIDVEGLSFSYRDVPVLQNVSFSVSEGSFSALIGSNGTGKSTLVKLLLGELEPTAGRISLFGEDISVFRKWPEIGYVSQEGLTRKADFPANVYEIVAASLYSRTGLFHFPTKKDRDRVYAALEEVGMKEYSRRLIGELSGGQRQRVLIARALCAEPKMMILDEPITGMDAASAVSFYELLRELNRKRGLTVFMVTHDLDRISAYADSIFCLEYGSLVPLTPEELRHEQEHRHEHPGHGHAEV